MKDEPKHSFNQVPLFVSHTLTSDMHVILSCVTPTKLIGSLLKGNKEKYYERNQDFFDIVASRYGLSLPPAKLYKTDRDKIAKVSILKIESTGDPMTKSPHYR